MVIKNHDSAINEARASLTGDAATSLRKVVAVLESQGEMVRALFEDHFSTTGRKRDSLRLEFMGLKMRGVGAGMVIIGAVAVIALILRLHT
jgi:hypothetical protein